MPVLDQRYRRWEGTPTSYVSRMLVIPRYDLLDIVQRKAWLAFFVASMLPPIVLAALVYFTANLEPLKALFPVLAVVKIPLPGARAYEMVGVVQMWLLVVFGLSVGPPLATRDFANNAMPLYLSKALRRWEYVMGRWSLLLLVFSVMSWVPLLLVLGLEMALTSAEWRSGHAWLAGAIVVGLVPVILLMTALVTAVASHVHRANLARAALLGIILVSWPFAKALEASTGSPLGRVISPLALTSRIESWAFEPPVEEAAATSAGLFGALAPKLPTAAKDDLSPRVAAIALAFWFAACVGVLAWRVRPVDVVS